MNAYEQEVKAVYEGLAERSLTDAEVADIVLTLRQFAAFLIECGRDEDLRAKLGVVPSAAPRVVNCTAQIDAEPLGQPLLAETDTPTVIPLRDSTHLESSASPAVSATATPGSPVQATSPARPS